MKDKYWRILVALVVVIAIFSYLLLFRSDITFDPIFGLPAKFAIGIFITVILVSFTFIGQAIFPFSDVKNSKDE